MKLPFDIVVGGLIGFGILYISSIMSRNKTELEDIEGKLKSINERVDELDNADDFEVYLEDDRNVPSQYRVRVASSPYWRV